ncbi:MAG: hypothetical protein ACRD2W_03390 [Acidimicrobiales bacterium]
MGGVVVANAGSFSKRPRPAAVPSDERTERNVFAEGFVPGIDVAEKGAGNVRRWSVATLGDRGIEFQSDDGYLLAAPILPLSKEMPLAHQMVIRDGKVIVFGGWLGPPNLSVLVRFSDGTVAQQPPKVRPASGEGLSWTAFAMETQTSTDPIAVELRSPDGRLIFQSAAHGRAASLSRQ